MQQVTQTTFWGQTWVTAAPLPAPMVVAPMHAPVPAGWGVRRDSAINMPPDVAHTNGPAFVTVASPAPATASPTAPAVPAGGQPALALRPRSDSGVGGV